MQRGEFGRLVDAAVEWRSFIVDGLHVRPADIPADEYFALRVLREEEPKETEESKPEVRNIDGQYPATGARGR